MSFRCRSSIDDLETSLAPVREELARKASRSRGRQRQAGQRDQERRRRRRDRARSRQLAIRFAESEARHEREACLIDLDVQFGDVAFQLGLRPKLSLADLLEAGTRLDGDLLRATTTEHRSGLKVIAAPADMMPLEGLSNEHLLQIVELATREFGTVFVDLPTNWTNWSLSLVARSDLVLLVTELTVAGLNRAQRQLNLLRIAGPGRARRPGRRQPLRKEPCRAPSGRPTCAKRSGRDVAYTVANDFALMRAAIDRGVPIDEVKRKSALAQGSRHRSTPALPPPSDWSARSCGRSANRNAARSPDDAEQRQRSWKSIGWSRSATPARSPSATRTPS